MEKKRKLDADPANEEPIEEDDQSESGEGEDDEAGSQEMEEEEGDDESEEDDDQNPQTLETPAPANVDPAADEEDDDEDEDEGEDELESDPSSVQKLLDPFPKDQLVDLLRDAAVLHPDVLERVHRVADADAAHRKVFVHGLEWDTNADALRSVFQQYGEIEDCNAVTDKATGKSKGYGFILFKHRAGAQQALREPQKKIGTRMTSCQLASAGPAPPPAPPVSEYTQRKIFVSNVGADLDPQKVLHFFSKFGEIEEGPLGLDKATGKPKGFCLFVYKTTEGAKKALEDPHKNYEGYTLHCQRAIDGPKPSKMGFQSHHAVGPSSVPAAVGPSDMGLNPALGQALAALLTNQGSGLGLANLLGSLGAAGIGGQVVNQSVPAPISNSGGFNMHGGYGGNTNPGWNVGYGAPTQPHGGYANTQARRGGGRKGMGRGGRRGGGRVPYRGR